jgi:GH24 family phage-related lysozyme (muramidase)
MPPQSTYLIRPGTSADQLAEQRQAAIAMLNEASSTKPVQHWTQILGQMAKGGLSGYEIGEAQREGRRAQDEAGGLFSQAFASLGGSSRVPGADVAPEASAAVAPSSPARGAAGAAGRQDQMPPTSDAFDMVRKEEGFAPVAKWDVRQHSGGYGSKSAPGEQFDQAKAEQYLQRDGGPVLNWVNANAPSANDLQKRALVSFGYNLGVDDLEKLKPDIQRGDWNRVGERMMSFNQAATGPGGALQPMDALTRRRGREAAMIRGGGAGGSPVSIAAPETDDERQNALIQQLYRNEQTRPIATALFSAKLAKDKDKKRHVVGPNASLVDDNGGLLYRGPEEDATAKARQQAIGKGQGEARLALPAAVSRAGETVGILEKLRAHPGLDAGTGATSLIASRVPGSDAYDFEQLRQQAQGTAFLTAIGEMRGTGAISNVEGEAATQAVGRMKSAQSKEAFLEALGDYERVVRTGVINTYRNAGMEIPPELMAARPAPGGAPSAAPGAPSSAPGSAAAARPASGAIKAPDGLQEGMTLRDTDSNEMMTVRGGMLVPANAPAARAPAAGGPMSPARGAAAAGDMGTTPEFLGRRGNPGDYREDRLKLLDNPSGAAIQAFNQVWGPGMAEKAIQRQKPLLWGEGQTVPQGRYGYKLGQ